MRWKPFFTPVPSLTPDEARSLLAESPEGDVTILDCRQPGEYEQGHIAGAVLVPLAQIADRAGELDADKPLVCYCAVGGRSRMASQLLSGKGFTRVYNLSGGIEAWEGRRAYGDPLQGLELFPAAQPLADALVVAYGMEEALRVFYLERSAAAVDGPVRELFERLARIEEAHRESIYRRYVEATGQAVEREHFLARVIEPRLEGGMTVEDYQALFGPDWTSQDDVLILAMTIEAQALDLYLRAARQAAEESARRALMQIAQEEKSHLEQLGALIGTGTDLPTDLV